MLLCVLDRFETRCVSAVRTLQIFNVVLQRSYEVAERLESGAALLQIADCSFDFDGRNVSVKTFPPAALMSGAPTSAPSKFSAIARSIAAL